MVYVADNIDKKEDTLSGINNFIIAVFDLKLKVSNVQVQTLNVNIFKALYI